jgi:hypothetical protein
MVVSGTGLLVLCRKRLSCHTRYEQQVMLCLVLSCVLGYGIVWYSVLVRRCLFHLLGCLNCKLQGLRTVGISGDHIQTIHRMSLTALSG